MYFPVSWQKSIYSRDSEDTVRGDIFIILLLSHPKRTNRTRYKTVCFGSRDVHVPRRIIIYKVNLPSYVFDAVADTGARTSDAIIIRSAFVGCYSDSGLSGDLCQRCLRAPNARIFGVHYRRGLYPNNAGIIGVAEEYGGTS
jgi:hypothetical protein